jgi:hypothetical protein
MATATAKRTARKRTTKPADTAPVVETAVAEAPVKRTARKSTAKAAAKPAAKRTAAKKAAATTTTVTTAPAKRTTRKAAAKSAVPAKSNGNSNARPVRMAPVATDPFNFLEGSDSSIAAHALVEGGASRAEINERVREELKKTNGLKTRSGREKIVSTIVGNVFLKLVEQGYEVDSHWKLKPPPEVAKAVAVNKRRAARKAAAK